MGKDRRQEPSEGQPLLLGSDSDLFANGFYTEEEIRHREGKGSYDYLSDGSMSSVWEEDGLPKHMIDSSLRSLDDPATRKRVHRSLLVLCLLSFLFFFNPFEPFLVHFFIEKGVSESSVYENILPLWTYAYLVSLLVVFSVTEKIGHFTVVLFGALMNVATSVILLYGNSMFWYQIQEVTSAFSFACLEAFNGLAYRVAPMGMYQSFSGYTRGSALFGTIVSSFLSEFLIQFVSLETILYITLVIRGLYLLLVLVLLPSPPKIPERPVVVVKDVVMEVLSSLRRFPVVLWTIFIAVSTAAHTWVLTFWQSLVELIQPGTEDNGYLVGTAYIFAALAALLSVRIRSKANHAGFCYLCGLLSVLSLGLSVLCLSYSSHLWQGFVFFTLFHSHFEFINSVSYVQLVLKLPNFHFASALSLCHVIGLVLQSIYQLSVGPYGMKMGIRAQFKGIALMLGVLFVMMVALLVGRAVVLEKRMAARKELLSWIRGGKINASSEEEEEDVDVEIGSNGSVYDEDEDDGTYNGEERKDKRKGNGKKPKNKKDVDVESVSSPTDESVGTEDANVCVER
eukprot:TRINITY_DN379_c0_g2_i2.p1 TRINITY_DN379_c0_g2~~TRINITY_DN379_c0_g2_i2.p1  ORF type:complete len:567 (-),score=141.48 TRINITY_DN379_c0_g2_i2:352-2052(-)